MPSTESHIVVEKGAAANEDVVCLSNCETFYILMLFSFLLISIARGPLYSLPRFIGNGAAHVCLLMLTLLSFFLF
jgi:hypothetical protein